jgi:tetratricopeptide (TPR) repeat protein
VPTDPVERAVLLKNERKMDLAAAAARKGVKQKPNSPRAHYVLAWVLVHVGKRKEATGEFNKAIQLNLSGKDRQEADAALKRLKGGGGASGGGPGGPGGGPSGGPIGGGPAGGPGGPK